ncbi:MAG TPA: helix-turn-helix transcriptional regulator [Bacteroidia bacterium]|nr:helix-turn-helix transcriptional regulator [Bacteroidia bacterium]
MAKTTKGKKKVKKTTVDAGLKQLGERMKQLRIAKGYTNYEYFAYEHNLPRAQYGRYEAGGNITYKNLKKIVDAFDITLEEFFSEGF